MERTEIISTLIQDANRIYTLPAYKSNPDFQRRVAEAEEELLFCLFSMNQASGSETDIRLADILEQVERLQNGKPLSSSDERIRSESVQNYLSIRTMEENRKASSHKQVPKALLAYIERSLDFEEQKSAPARTPGFSVRLLSEGLSVIKSSLQGFRLEPVLAPATRLQSSDNRKQAHLCYQSKIGPVYIELFSEGKKRLAVRFRFPQALKGQAILKYVEGKDLTQTRILDSYSLNNESEVSFSGLEQGSYVAEIPALDCRLPFLVQ